MHLIGRKFEIFEKFRKNFMALNKRDDNAVIEVLYHMVFQKSRRKRELEICFNLIRNKVHFRGISECRKNLGFTNFIMTHLKSFVKKYNNLLKPSLSRSII